MRPWWKRRAVELLPEPVGSRPEGKTIRVRPLAERMADDPEMSDADRVKLWKNLAESRRARMADLRAEIDRLRADLALAVHARRRLVECGHEATLRRYDALLERCRAEHVDRDELERRVGAATRAASNEPTFQEIAAIKRRDDR